MGAPIGRTLATDVTCCLGMNGGPRHSLHGTRDQRGPARDESGRYDELARTTMTYRGMAYSGRPLGPRSAHMSRGGHVPLRRPGKLVTGQCALRGARDVPVGERDDWSDVVNPAPYL